MMARLSSSVGRALSTIEIRAGSFASEPELEP